jgi:hypothetical protein
LQTFEPGTSWLKIGSDTAELRRDHYAHLRYTIYEVLDLDLKLAVTSVCKIVWKTSNVLNCYLLQEYFVAKLWAISKYYILSKRVDGEKKYVENVEDIWLSYPGLNFKADSSCEVVVVVTQGATENSHIGHCTHSSESTNVKVQNI